HNDEFFLPDLIKIGIIHYQFETIHPFLDGNGRVGRLLITLYLVDKGILKQPILYLSDFFEQHKPLYYDNLMRVRTHSDLKQWLKFFLVGITETAQNGVKTFDEILKLKVQSEEAIQTLGLRFNNAIKVLNHLFKRPIIDIKAVIDITHVSQRTAYNIIADLVNLGILKEVSGGKRDRIYAFRKYLDLFT